jgi:hypothetical protein
MHLVVYWLDREGKSKENKIKKMCQSPQIFWLRSKKLFIFHIFSSLFAAAWQLNTLEVILNFFIIIWFLHLNKRNGGCRDEIKQ